MSANERAAWREEARSLLKAEGFPFVETDSGIKFVVESKRGYVDFWPGTGNWIPRGATVKSFGLRALITYLKEER